MAFVNRCQSCARDISQYRIAFDAAYQERQLALVSAGKSQMSEIPMADVLNGMSVGKCCRRHLFTYRSYMQQKYFPYPQHSQYVYHPPNYVHRLDERPADLGHDIITVEQIRAAKRNISDPPKPAKLHGRLPTKNVEPIARLPILRKRIGKAKK